MCGSRDFCDHAPRQQFVCVVLYLGGEFACFVAFYFIDVDVLIRPEDAQKYVSSRSCVLFSFCDSSRELYICNFSCTEPTELRVTE